MIQKENNNKIFLTSLILFLLCLPISLLIDFKHNDDWLYYIQVQNFLGWNFKLDDYMGANFYSVGIFGTIFAKVFGITNLPILTLLISIGCFAITALILNNILKSQLKSILLALLLYLSPIFIFTTWGFMTDNYFLFFLLVSVYFINKENDTRIQKHKLIYFFLANLFIIISYFARQLGIIISASYAISLLLKKSYKKAFVQFLISGILVLYHFKFFPKTPAMWENNFGYENLGHMRLVFSFVFIIAIYASMFLMPIIVGYIKSINKNDKKYFIVGFVILLTIFLLYFKPATKYREDFPYLIYTVSKNGFFLENVHGHKQEFILKNQINISWLIIGKILAVGFIIKLIIDFFKQKNILNFYSIFISMYLTVMIISPLVYDRYLIPILPIIIFFLSTKIKFSKNLLRLFLIFILFLGFYSYNYSLDYILTNKYIWNKSEDLVHSQEATTGSIFSTDGWHYLYKQDSVFTHEFSYSNKISRNEYNSKIIDEKIIKFPLSIWGPIPIYLHKLELKQPN